MLTLAPQSLPVSPGLLAPGELWLPGPALAGCLRGVMVRRTLGHSLSAAQRVNHLPCSPLASLSCWIVGSAHALPMPPAQVPAGVDADALPGRAPLLADWVLGGPLSRPCSSWNPGPVHVLTLLFLPEALQALTGLDPGTLMDRFVNAASLLPPDWRGLREQLLQAPDDATRLRGLEDFLRARWAACRSPSWAGSPQLADWTTHLAQRAALSGAGRSLRQWERRIKRWTGQPLRGLRGLARGEQALLNSVAAYVRDGEVNWAELALENGYADQPHLCRETRRYTGFTPEQLRQGMLTHEAFWPYRLWV